MPLIFIAVIGAYQVLLFLVHVAVYETWAAAFGWADHWYAVLFGSLSLSFSFLVASLLSHRVAGGIVRRFYQASAYWLGLIHFLFAGSVVFFLLEKLLHRNNYYAPPALLGGICFGVFFFLHAYMTWESSQAQITRIAVSLPRLPSAWRNKTVVFVSDLHLGNVWGWRSAAKIARMIRALSPEAVFVGGDVFDGVRCNPGELIFPWKTLVAPLGVYFVSGNHEYLEGTDEINRAIRGTGITILENEIKDLRGIQLVGVDWKSTHERGQFENALKSLPLDPAKPSILLKHEPSDIDLAEKFGISFGLSGHTHGGAQFQVFPLTYLVRMLYKGFDYGLKKLGRMIVYVSSGVGTWGPPLRLGTKSEIVAITLK